MTTTIRLDSTHPLNVPVLAALRAKARGCAEVALPEDYVDAYMGLGSQPDIVERVWDQLGAALPGVVCAVVYGTPALIESHSGVVIAFTLGTSYLLRVPDANFRTALAQGCKVEQRWSDDSTTHSGDTYGPGWVFGAWNAQEVDWLRATCEPSSLLTSTKQS